MYNFTFELVKCSIEQFVLTFFLRYYQSFMFFVSWPSYSNTRLTDFLVVFKLFNFKFCLDDLNKPGEKSRSRLVFGGNFIASEKLVKREGDYLKVRQNRNDFFKPTFPPKK